MVRFLIAFPILMHGLAHLSGMMASWKPQSAGFSDRPWIFSSSLTLSSPVGRVFGLVWLVAALGFVATAIGIITTQQWWPMVALGACVASLVAIVPWWNTVVAGAKAGFVFDLLIILALMVPIARDRWLAVVS